MLCRAGCPAGGVGWGVARGGWAEEPVIRMRGRPRKPICRSWVPTGPLLVGVLLVGDETPIGIVAGLILGLIVGWGLWPVEWQNAWPADLADELAIRLRRTAVRAFRALDLAGFRSGSMNDTLADAASADATSADATSGGETL